MTTIEHSSIIDMRDLADLATTCYEVLVDDADTYDEDERLEAKETLEALAKFMNELGYWDVTADAPEELADEIRAYGDNEPTLISKDYFEEYCEELVRDIGDLPKDLPWYIQNNINWAGIAEDLKVDYNEVELDGEDYLIRSH